MISTTVYFFSQDIPEAPERKMTDQINEVDDSLPALAVCVGGYRVISRCCRLFSSVGSLLRSNLFICQDVMKIEGSQSLYVAMAKCFSCCVATIPCSCSSTP